MASSILNTRKERQTIWLLLHFLSFEKITSNLRSVRVIFGIGEVLGNSNTSVGKTETSSKPDDVSRGAVHNLLGEGLEPSSDRVLLMGGN